MGQIGNFQVLNLKFKISHWLNRNLATNRKAIVILAIAGFLVYINALPNGMFWDDDDGILNNMYIRDWSNFDKFFSQSLVAGSGLSSNYWRPLLLIIYSLEWHIWGDSAPGYHLISILIHTAASGALFLLLTNLLKKRLVSFLTSLFFLIHPVQTEAVTYVSGLADPLSALFIFLGARFHLEDAGKQRLWVIVFFVLGLLTKERTAVVFPIFLLLIDIFVYFKDKKTFSLPLFILAELKKLWPYFALSVAYAVLRGTVLNFNDTFNLYDEENVYTENLWVRIITFLFILPSYMELIFAPHDLHMERSAEFITSLRNLRVWVGAIIAFSLMAGTYLLRRRKPEYSLALAWFLVMIFPSSGILMPVSGLFWEHYLYFPIIGVILFIFLAGEDILKKWDGPKIKGVAGALAVIALLALSWTTLERNRDWRDPITFYNNVIRYNRESLRVWNNLGMAYAEAQDFDRAVDSYEAAIALDAKNQSAPPHHNLANAYASKGETEKAIEEYKKALAIDEKFIYSYYFLANLYIARKDYQSAVSLFETASKVYPEDAGIENVLSELKKIEDR